MPIHCGCRGRDGFAREPQSVSDMSGSERNSKDGNSARRRGHIM